MRIVEIVDPPAIEALIERFGRAEQSFILDSSQSNDGLGQWSFLGANPFRVVDSTLEELRTVMEPYSIKNDTEIPFVGGAVGFLSYDYGRQIETLPSHAAADRSIPDMRFGLYDGVAALNHASGKLFLVATGVARPESETLQQLKDTVYDAGLTTNQETFCVGDWRWNLSKAQFLEAVGRVKDYIASGDVYQVNLSRRARSRFNGSPVELYQALRAGNPAPYSAYIPAGDLTVLSTSPEQFLLKRGRHLETRPIKGTRPRGMTPEMDVLNAEDLKRSEKDRAELLMIVDLERNDLGRVAEFGSVKVEGLYNLEHYARVIHQTARVKATLAEGKDVFDCIRALFPGGSITGAPKVRAMEIIEELEPTRRGVYCGSVGYIGFDGDAELNIAIRSLHLLDGYLDYQVGGGIVWDSDPESEYQETLDKGRAIRETIDSLCQNQ